jgi:hypothetical protein
MTARALTDAVALHMSAIQTALPANVTALVALDETESHSIKAVCRCP